MKTRAKLVVEIVAIGREILDGRVVDTNSVSIAHLLHRVGLVPRFGQRVDDDAVRISDALRVAADRSDVVLVTGGLGPTSDDRTAEAFASFLGAPLEPNPEALGQVTSYFERMKRTMLDVQRKQAMVPRSCFVLPNHEGSAPGFGCVRDGVSFFVLPGVPHEMKRMLREQVLPRLIASGAGTSTRRSMTWATQFTTEGELQQALASAESRLPEGFEITYRTKFPENHVALYGDCTDAKLEGAFDRLCAEIGGVLGASVFTTAVDGEPVATIEEGIVGRLIGRGGFLCTAESCTGGLVAHRITNVPDASKVFWGSVVTYANTAKDRMAGVSPETVRAHGAVSEEVARALAEGCLKSMTGAIAAGAPAYCLSTTGIAGPSGGTELKPVGLCFVALARSDGPTVVERVQGRSGLSREANKTLFAQKALDLIRRTI